MPSVCRPRRPRASPLWQLVHHYWSAFESGCEKRHRPIHGPLRHDAIAVVRQFHRCGELGAGFTRLQCSSAPVLQCSDCGHERLLAFTCKTRHFCPSCHQRKVRQTGDWIARVLCFEVPHRQFVFTMPKPLRGIFRKRCKLLDHLFSAAIASLRDWMRARLALREGQLAAVAAAVQTFGDHLNRTLFEQVPGNGGEDGATPTCDKEREEARARGGDSTGDSLRPSASRATERTRPPSLACRAMPRSRPILCRSVHSGNCSLIDT